MHAFVAELRKTGEIRSSKRDQLGTISQVFGNRIVMSVSVGRRGQFAVPEKIIGKMKKGIVHLTLNKKEFQKWWATEGQNLQKEYEQNPDIALGKKLTKEDLSLLRNDIETALESNFGDKLPKEQKKKLCSEQENLRISLPPFIRDGLDSDEWTLRSFRFTEQEDDIFVVTSKRLIRSKSGWGKWHNWTIPLDKIESISKLTMSHPRSEVGDIWKGGGTHYIFYYALRFKYGKGKRLEHKDFWMPFEVTYKEQECVKEFVEELIRSRGAKPSLPVVIPGPLCSSCGHGNPSDAEFCIECGRHLK